MCVDQSIHINLEAAILYISHHLILYNSHLLGSRFPVEADLYKQIIDRILVNPAILRYKNSK